MKNKEKWQRLVELNQKIKQAKKLYKEIVDELLPDLKDASISVDGFSINPTERTTLKLNWNKTEKELCKQFPEFTKFDLKKFKETNPWMIDHIAKITITKSLSITKNKNVTKDTNVS